MIRIRMHPSILFEFQDMTAVWTAVPNGAHLLRCILSNKGRGMTASCRVGKTSLIKNFYSIFRYKAESLNCRILTLGFAHVCPLTFSESFLISSVYTWNLCLSKNKEFFIEPLRTWNVKTTLETRFCSTQYCVSIWYCSDIAWTQFFI